MNLTEVREMVEAVESQLAAKAFVVAHVLERDPYCELSCEVEEEGR